MSTESEEEAKSDSSDEDSHHNHSHTKHSDHTLSHHHSHLSSKLYESDNPDDIFNRDRENESKISNYQISN